MNRAFLGNVIAVEENSIHWAVVSAKSADGQHAVFALVSEHFDVFYSQNCLGFVGLVQRQKSRRLPVKIAFIRMCVQMSNIDRRSTRIR